MTRTLILAAATVVVAAQSAAAQGGRHPLVGQWEVRCAGPVANADGAATAPSTAVLTIAQDGNQLVATLQTASARANSAAHTHRLRGVVVGDSAQFTFTAPLRVIDGHRQALRDAHVRWVIGAHEGTLTGSQLRVISATSEVLPATPISGMRIGG